MSAPDDGYFPGSILLKSTLLTVAFSTVYAYEENSFIVAIPTVPTPLQPTLRLSTTVRQEKPKKTIYLTFDDGPNAGTKKVLDILKAEEIPATFFLVGEHTSASKEQKNIYSYLKDNDQVEIANHSYTHAHHNAYTYFYAHPDTVKADFDRCSDSLRLRSNIARTPGRNIWRTKNISSTDLKGSTQAADSLKENNYVLVGWDVEWHYDKDQHLIQSDTMMIAEIRSVFTRSATKTKDALVLLAHDRTFFSSTDSASLHNLLIKLKRLELYDFATISHYPALKE